MTGTLIVSLDCEGKWGMADGLQPYHHLLLTDAALAAVYKDLVKLFATYDISATFAFVMAFTMSPTDRKECGHLLEQGEAKDPWLSHFWRAQEEGHSEGWFQPDALDTVRADSRHEIASHSFCHRPLSDDSISAEGAEIELKTAEALAARKGLTLRTLVYPRNQVGHLAVVRKLGYWGFRELLPRRSGRIGQFASLASELNIRPRPQASRVNGSQLIPIPAGYFFNWRFGARRFVPAGVTVLRWKTLLNRAAERGEVAHLWLHPHNLITAPSTRAPLDAVLRYASELASRDRIRIMTQEQYSSELRRPLRS